MSDGWIKLHRKIQDNELWTSEKFTRGQAWVDLLILANHDYGYFYVRDHKIEVNRGFVGFSILKLSFRWKWSRTKVKNFLNQLEKVQQIKQHISQSYSLIEIINYDKYQEKEQQAGQQKDNRNTTEIQQKDTNKNDKNDKNDKKYIEEKKNQKKIIYPNLEEVISYFNENGYPKSLAERFFKGYSEANWNDSKGNKVRNWKQKAQMVWFKEENNKSSCAKNKFRNESIAKYSDKL